MEKEQGMRQIDHALLDEVGAVVARFSKERAPISLTQVEEELRAEWGNRVIRQGLVRVALALHMTPYRVDGEYRPAGPGVFTRNPDYQRRPYHTPEVRIPPHEIAWAVADRYLAQNENPAWIDPMVQQFAADCAAGITPEAVRDYKRVLEVLEIAYGWCSRHDMGIKQANWQADTYKALLDLDP